MQQALTVRQLTARASQEPPGAPQTTAEEPEGEENPARPPGGAQEGSERRSWWREFFGIGG